MPRRCSDSASELAADRRKRVIRGGQGTTCGCRGRIGQWRQDIDDVERVPEVADPCFGDQGQDHRGASVPAARRHRQDHLGTRRRFALCDRGDVGKIDRQGVPPARHVIVDRPPPGEREAREVAARLQTRQEAVRRERRSRPAGSTTGSPRRTRGSGRAPAIGSSPASPTAPRRRAGTHWILQKIGTI